jgi:hypothetical protein
MSPPPRNGAGAPRRAQAPTKAPIFAALGDKTRLALVATFALTRQAITKHLRVLERAGIVHSRRRGRESRFQFDPRPIEQVRTYLDLVAEHWDQALSRLKSLVEG